MHSEACVTMYHSAYAIEASITWYTYLLNVFNLYAGYTVCVCANKDDYS
jgi:hypothetical protein